MASSERRRAAGVRFVAAAAATCGMLVIGIGAAAISYGGTPAIGDRPAAAGGENVTPAVMRAPAPGVLQLAAAVALPWTGREAAPAAARGGDAELSPRANVAGGVPAERGAAPSAAATPPAAAEALSLALLRPSGGVITSRFGWRMHPIFGTREFHTGVDIATRYGSPVVAARAGVVLFVGWKSGYGRIVVLDHGGGFQTTYSHLSAALVNPGEEVEPGQAIGRIGSSGWSTGPHLFFEVRRNGVPVDPARYLN